MQPAAANIQQSPADKVRCTVVDVGSGQMHCLNSSARMVHSFMMLLMVHLQHCSKQCCNVD